jgi:hypothetical protein
MAQITQLYGETYIGHLLELKLRTGVKANYQNYAPYETVSFQNKQYNFIPFEVVSYSQSLEVDSEQLEIRIVNSEVIRTFLRDAGDVRRSTLILKTVFPDDESYKIDVQRTTVSSYSTSKGVIIFQCSSPLTAINGQIPARVFDPNTFPQLPFFNIQVKNNVIR